MFSHLFIVQGGQARKLWLSNLWFSMLKPKKRLLRHGTYFIYSILLKANVSPDFIYKLIGNMSKLTHVMIDGGDILDEEELFELLEIGIYVLTVLTRKERDISKSSVKKGF